MVKSGDQTFRRNRQFLKHAAEPTTQDKQRNKDDTTLPSVNLKKVPTEPIWPATPFFKYHAGKLTTHESCGAFIQHKQSFTSLSQKTRTRSTRPDSKTLIRNVSNGVK